MDYYTYGNSDIAKMMFDAVLKLTNTGGSFSGFYTFMVLVAFFAVLGKVIYMQDFRPLAGWFITIVVVFGTMFIPKTTVQIVDITNPTSVKVVNNVPLGLAFFGSATSTIGKWFGSAADIVFTPINDINYSNTGLVFGANSYRSLRKVNVMRYMPELQYDISQFIENCSAYDISLYKFYSVAQLRDSTDLLTVMGQTNQALTTPVFNSTTKALETKTCIDAYASIKPRVLSLASNPALLTALTADMRSDIVSSSGQMTSTQKNKVLTNMQATYTQMFFNASKSSQQIITQEAMVNAFKTASLQHAQFSGSPAQMQAAIASATAENQAVVQHNTAAVMASKYLPIVSNVIEAILIGLFPLVLGFAIVAGMAAFNAIWNYVATLLWIKLWPGLFAMINGIGGMYHVMQTRAATANVGGTTLANSLDVIGVSNSTIAFAGYLSMAVPLIAWGLVKLGSTGLQSAFGSATASTQKTGDQAAASVGAGNTSVGNVSMNTSRANIMDNPFVAREQGYAGTTVSNTSGGQYTQAAAGLPVTASQDLSRVAEASSRVAQTQRAVQTESANLSQATSATQAQTWAYMSSKGDGYAQSVLNSSSATASDKQAFNQLRQTVSEVASKNGVTLDSTTTDKLALQLGGGLNNQSTSSSGNSQSTSTSGGNSRSTQNSSNGLVASLSQMIRGNVGLDTAHSSSQKVDQIASDMVKAASSQGIQLSSDLSNSIASSDSFKHDLQSGNTYAQGLNSAIMQQQSAQHSYGMAVEQASSAEKALSDTTRASTSIGTNLAALTAQYAESHPGENLNSPESIQSQKEFIAQKLGVSSSMPEETGLRESVSSNLANGSKNVAALYNGGSSQVNSFGSNGANSVAKSAGDLATMNVQSGFEQKGAEVGAGMSNQQQKIGNGDKQVGTETANIQGLVGTTSQLTSTQKFFNADGSSFGSKEENPNSPEYMSDKNIEKSKQVQTLTGNNGGEQFPKPPGDPIRTPQTTLAGDNSVPLRKLNRNPSKIRR